MQDQNMQNLEPVSMNEEKMTESAPKEVPESCATEVEEVREIIDVVEKKENVMTEAAITTPEVWNMVHESDLNVCLFPSDCLLLPE